MISFVTGEESVSDRSPADKEEDLILVEYLSGLTLKEGEEEELLLPDKELPNRFEFFFKRSCMRTLFSYGNDFAIIVSKETKCNLNGKDEEKEEVTVSRTLDIILFFLPCYFFLFFSLFVYLSFLVILRFNLYRFLFVCRIFLSHFS